MPVPFINTAASPTSMAVNAYRTPAFYGLNRLVFTNTTPGTAYRGAGRPSVSYLVERLVDEAARQTGIDRIELRQRNLLAKDAFPYKTPTGSTYDSGDPQGLLAQVLQEADWSGFERRRAAGEDARAAARHRLRDLHRAFRRRRSGGDRDPVRRRRRRCGSTPMSGPSGQGHETVYPDLVADILGIAADDIDAALQRSRRAEPWPAPAPSARARSSATAARCRSAPTR